MSRKPAWYRQGSQVPPLPNEKMVAAAQSTSILPSLFARVFSYGSRHSKAMMKCLIAFENVLLLSRVERCGRMSGDLR